MDIFAKLFQVSTVYYNCTGIDICHRNAQLFYIPCVNIQPSVNCYIIPAIEYILAIEQHIYPPDKMVAIIFPKHFIRRNIQNSLFIQFI